MQNTLAHSEKPNKFLGLDIEVEYSHGGKKIWQLKVIEKSGNKAR